MIDQLTIIHVGEKKKKAKKDLRVSSGSQAMVKLLTHNFLCSPVKGIKNTYPLQIRADEVE